MRQAKQKWGKLIRMRSIVLSAMLLTVFLQGAIAEERQFEEPVIKINSYYDSDEPVEISAAWPEGAGSMAIFVHDDQGGDAVPGCHWDRKDDGSETCTYEVNVQDRHLEPGFYTAVVEVQGEGYRTMRCEKQFEILSGWMSLENQEIPLIENEQDTPVPEEAVPASVEEQPERLEIQIPLELTFPDTLDDPEMQLLIEQGLVTEKDTISLQPPQKQVKLYLDQYEFQAYYNQATGKRTKKYDIRLSSTDYGPGDIVLDGQYDKDQKLVAFWVHRNLTEGDTSVEMHDNYHPDGSYYFERIVTTPELDYYYLFSDHQQQIHRSNLSFSFDLPEKEWILYTVTDAELDSVVKNPDFKYKYKLGEVTLAGKLDFYTRQILNDEPEQIVALVSTNQPEPTGSALEFRQGSQLVLFNQDGMRLTLTGEVEDKGGLNIELAARFENKTGKDLNLMAEGSVNGMKMTPTFVKKSNTESGKTSDCAIQISYNDFDLSRYTDIRQMQLSFKAQETKTQETSSSSSSSSSSSKSGDASAFSSASASSFASSSTSVTSIVGVYKSIAPIDVWFADHMETEGDRFFEEQPALAHPSNYVDVKVTGSSTASSNGKPTSATYTFAPKNKVEKVEALMKIYLDELVKQGLKVDKSGGGYAIYSSDGKPLATIGADNGTFTITLIL